MLKNKMVCLSDLHLVGSNPISRIDDLVKSQWDKLIEVFIFAYQHKADIYLAGDIFDSSNNYSILNRMAEILFGYKNLGVNVYCVFGQHDMKYRNEKNTNLEILSNAGLVTVLNSTPLEGDGIRLYGCGWKSNVPIPSEKDSLDILVTHAPISPGAIFHGHNYINIKDFVKENPTYDLIICGDVHRTFMDECNDTVVLNSGPLLRKEANEYNMVHKPGFFFIDLEKISISYKEIKHRQSSEVLKRDHIEKKKRQEFVSTVVNTAQFLCELRERSTKGQMLNIQERMKLIVASKDNFTSHSARSILEHLLNEKDLDKWIESKSAKN